MKTEDLIAEATALPVEGRALIVDSLLRTLNGSDPANDEKWLAVAKRRLEELRSGEVKGIPAEEVFERIRNKYSK